MNIETLTVFFMWCTVINVAMLMVSSLLFIVAPGWVYRMQYRWFPISKETFTITYYAFIGGYKILIIVFNLVPYIVLRVIS